MSDCKSFSHFIKCRFSFFFSLARYSSILKIFLRCARKIIKLGVIDFCLQRKMVCFAINMMWFKSIKWLSTSNKPNIILIWSVRLNLFDRFFSLLIPSVSLWITFHPLSPPPSLHSSYSNYRPLTLIMSFTNQLVPRETNSVVTTTENLIIRHRRSRILTNIKLQLSHFAQCFSWGGKIYCSCSLQL